MAEADRVKRIQEEVVARLSRAARPVIGNVSNRHLHLTRAAVETLFGPGRRLEKLRDLIQPGQFAAKETVTIVGPKGQIANVRIVGPARAYTQVEIARTDAVQIGVNPPVRESGDLKGSAPVTILGPKGRLDLPQGCIIAWRHLHFHPREAAEMGITDKQLVRVAVEGERATVFERVLCRVREDMALECHLDTDEANAAGMGNGTTVHLA